MSLNTSHHGDGGLLIHQGEVILLHSPSTTLSFTGNDDLKPYKDLQGPLYLTSHRLVFLNKKAPTTGLKSFSLPFGLLSEVNVEQPVFSSNFIKGKVRSQQQQLNLSQDGWRGEAKFKLDFPRGGAIDFAQGMLKAIAIARQLNSNNSAWASPPPDYATATGMPAPTHAYAPAQNYYGWTAPTSFNFPPPEAGSIYMTEAPPPYPGIGGGQPAAAGFAFPQQQFAYGNGNQAFMPAPPPYTPTPQMEQQQPYNYNYDQSQDSAAGKKQN